MFERLIELNTAKLAKEKGFDWPTLGFYFKNFNAGLDYILVDYVGEGQFGDIISVENHNSPESEYEIERLSAPTKFLLQMWLREVHNINVFVLPNRFDGKQWYYAIGSEVISKEDTGMSMSYEQALEKGLIEALKLLL